MPGSNRRPTACKADVITTTLDPFLHGFTNPAISRSKGAAVGRTPRSELADFAYMVGALTIGFVEAAGGASRHRFCLHAVADTVPALFATADRSSCGLRERFEPESQHALPCSQAHKSPRGVDTSSKEPHGIAIVNPHHSSSSTDAHTAKADARTAARASTGAQHRRTTNKKRRPPPRPRALRRSIILPTSERRRRDIPLHQR